MINTEVLKKVYWKYLKNLTLIELFIENNLTIP